MSLPEHLIIDDVPRPTTNSRGLPIHPTEEGVRNFWAWFGNSKCVDQEDRPLVFFHGTGSNFHIFKRGIKGGMYFTTDSEYASVIAESKGSGLGAVMPLYLRSINPLTLPGRDYSHNMITIANDDGHDSLIATDIMAPGNMSTVVVFEPLQLKSAIGNSGAFCQNNPSLTDHEEVTFRLEHRGHAHGQDDYTLYAYRGALRVGHIDYSVYRNTPAVQMIHVEAFALRQGIGTQMVLKLQKEHPDTQINFGGLTEAGARFFERLPKVILPSPQAPLFDERNAAIELKKQILAKADALLKSQTSPTEVENAAYGELIAPLNDLYDKIDKLDRELTDASPVRVLIRNAAAVAPTHSTTPAPAP